MIALVLVSHSAKLAEGVRDLAQQMTQGRVPIAVAGGIDDEQNPIGTDPIKIMEAITEVYSPDGVIVLMDIGSALMSAETAFDLLDPDWREHLHLCAAPFVEGAVIAAVQAGLGSSVAQVMEAAQGALAAKQQYLGVATPAPVAPSAPPATAHSLTIALPNRLGIHARPAARIVGLAGKHNARLSLRKGAQTVDGRNITQVMLLDARQGDTIEFLADGAEAAALLADVQALVNDNLGDDDLPAPEHSAPQAAPQSDAVLQGIPAANGLALGRVVLLEDQPLLIEAQTARPPAEEIAYFHAAQMRTAEHLHQLATHSSGAQAGIFEAHRLIAQDTDLTVATERAILDRSQSAAAAGWAAKQDMTERYRQSDSAYLQGRAADVLDVGQQVLAELAPGSIRQLALHEPAILAAADLAPSELARLDASHLLGLLTRYGGAASHTAILARSMGLPAVVGLGDAYTGLASGQKIALDGERGWVYPHPDETQRSAIQTAMERQRTDRAALLTRSRLHALTPDGRRIEVAANVGGPSDAARVLEQGAEGVGVLRTELLFMGRSTMPDEEVQYTAYCAVAQALQGHPVIIRTLDVGGDKHIPYIPIPPEDNPFLGYRGIRCWLDDLLLSRTQLRAICRASANHPIKIMFPMVSTVEEVEMLQQRLQQTYAELEHDGLPYNPRMEVGIMIEVPSAVFSAAQLAEQVDFFSIGTNDLTQYLLAADRGNARVTPLATAFQPALLRAIQQVVKAAHAQRRWVGVCGEMAGNPLLTEVLIGLDVDELSMNAPSIARVKHIIRHTRYADAQATATAVLRLPNARQIEGFLRERAGTGA